LAVEAFPLERWSVPESWNSGVPLQGEIATIPVGRTIFLDIDPPELGGLVIEGELVFDDKDLNLVSRWILIDGGSLILGSSADYHLSQATITLTGVDEDVEDDRVPGHMGSKFLGVINGGRLELHGERAEALNWTQLSEHAFAGSSQLEVDRLVDWKAGDRLVIAPSGFDPNEAEEVTVTSVSDGVTQFEPPLVFDHWGKLQTIGGHVIDERAEVACLSRNIVIQGDEASVELEFGGHLMFGPESTIHIEGVEFYRMGQKGHAARYPIHWHLAGDRRGDYARGNSIHHSYHRGIVVHGASNVLVEGNVCYDVWSHTFVPSEDGSERGNHFINNLGVLTQRLALADYTFPESAAGASFQSEGRPGIFWMRNPDHVLIGNHAAGVVNGMGFFYDGPGLSSEWTGMFRDNVAHSCLGPAGSAADRYPGITVGYGLFMEDQIAPEQISFQNFTAYKNTLSGIWLESPGQLAQNAILADNGTGAILFQATLEDSVIVGQSGNTIGELPQIGTSQSGGVHIVSGPSLKAPQLHSVDFIDQRDAGIVLLGDNLHPLSTLENLVFRNTNPVWIAEPSRLVGGFTDLDGSLRADGIPAFVHGLEPLAVTGETIFDTALGLWVSPLDTLLYFSLTNPDSEEVGFTVLKRDDKTGEIPDTSLSGRLPTLSGYLKRDSSYEMLRFDPLPSGVGISIKGDDSGYLILESTRETDPHFYHETLSALGSSVPDFEYSLSAAFGISELLEEAGPSFFYDPLGLTLHQRLVGNQTVFLFDQLAGGLKVSDPEVLWRSQQFGYQNVLIDDAQSDWHPLSDPDGDGLKNRMEFFMDTNPLQSDNPIALDAIGRKLTFPWNPKASNLDFIVSYSEDLVSWHSDAEIRSGQTGGEINQIHAFVPDRLSSKNLFMTLRVQPSP